jgi:hypothetical protein
MNNNYFMQADLSDNDEIGVDFDNFNIQEELKLFDDCKLKPVEILIRLYIQPKKTKGGIIIDNSKDIFNEIVGYVAKIGDCALEGLFEAHRGKLLLSCRLCCVPCVVTNKLVTD